MTTRSQYTAVMWSWVNGRWHRINGARPGRAAVKDARGTKPAITEVTNDHLLEDLQRRLAYAESHGHKVRYMVTIDGRCPPSPGDN